MSWLFSQALVEESLRATNLDGTQCARLSVMRTALPFWRNGKPMEYSRFSRFGLTCDLLTDTHGEALLRWFQGDFLARISPALGAETDWTVSDQDSGFTWPGSFAKYSRDSSTWKTRQCLLDGDLEEFSEIWPSSGSMRNGECSVRPPLAHGTSESESGLLPTPCTIDSGSLFNRSDSDGAALRPTLGAMARFDLWPTPTVKGNYNRKGLSSKSGDGLATAVAQWPTPTARDHRGVHRKQRGLERRQESKRGIPLNEAAGGLLNPMWVEWLMGWPIGWTALEPLAMDRFLEWQQQHGDSCGNE